MADETPRLETVAATAGAYSLQAAVPVVVVGDQTQAIGDNDDEMDPSSFFEYLRSPQGHEIAKGVLGIVQDVKRAAVSHTAGNAKIEKYLQVGIVFAVIVAATVLAALNKLDSPVAILFGTLVGYVFGRKGS